MENIARRVQAGELDCEIALIVCDKADALALKRAAKLRLETFLMDAKQFKSRSEFDARIDQELERRSIDFILLAGFMRILGSEFVRKWRWRILNVHPAILPKYPGAYAIKDAFEAKEKETGVTIHFVDEGVDTGPIILQRSVPIKADDTLEALEARVHAVEYELYPEAIRLFLAGKLSVKGNQVVIQRTR